MDLKNMLIDSKSAWVDFPGMPGFEVEVVNLSRKELQKLRRSCEITKFDRKTRFPETTLDEEKFVKLFSEKTIKNWKGLTYEYLETLVLVDVTGRDLKEELKYSKDNAEVLISQSAEFDSWLNEVVFDLEFFRTRGEGTPVEETGEVLPTSGE